jgi:ribosomal protein S18 acetylase RimI-like enzyme
VGGSAVALDQVTSVTTELVEAFARLIPQLSSSSPPPTFEELDEIVHDPGSTIFVARLDGRIVGTLTLVTFRIPTAVRAWIEDVVVDRDASGHHAGEALTRAALDLAAELGARTVELTSRPSREAANHIYRKVGFELRETNVYRFRLLEEHD